MIYFGKIMFLKLEDKFIINFQITKYLSFLQNDFRENKKPLKCLKFSGLRFCPFCLSGERGIRTPGPSYDGQRFSRPPHSTTLPSLRNRVQNYKFILIFALNVLKKRNPNIIYPGFYER